MIVIAQKINILFLKKDREKILDFLQNKKIIEVIGEHFVKKEISEIELHTESAKVKYILDLLAAFQKKKKKKKKFLNKIKNILTPTKIILTPEEIEKKVKEFNLEETYKNCSTLETRLNVIDHLIETLNQRKKVCQEWQELSFSVQEVQKLKNLKVIFGIGNEETIKELQNLNLGDLKIVAHEPNLKFCLFFHPKIEINVNEILKKFKIEPEKTLEKLEKLPKEELKEIDKELKKLVTERGDIINKINELSSFKKNLEIISDYLNWQIIKMETSLKAAESDYTVSLLGWIDGSREDELHCGLKQITPHFEILKLKPKEDEEPPIIIKEKKYLKPFSLITNMYGVPQKNEIDPLSITSFFFTLFFALCLGDAGYGLFLFLFPLMLMKFFKIPPARKAFLYLLTYLGVATFLVGALSGAWFGLDLASLPQGTLRNTLLKIKLFDPMKNPMQILILCFGIGIFQILVGILLKMYIEIKTKGKKTAFLNQFPWVYFFISLILFVISKIKTLPFEPKYLLLSGFIFLLLTQGRHQKKFILKFLGGLGSFYNLIGYFSDTVSYARLLALGLATGVIASVVNLITGMVSGVFIIGPIMALLVFVFGHLFNLVLSSFGAFIHSMRLQFVEFFPKFFSAGGRKFNPFEKKGEYIEIKF